MQNAPALKNASIFVAIAAVCGLASAVVLIHNAIVKPETTKTVAKTVKPMTGRSSARDSASPYGGIYVDPSFQAAMKQP